MRRIIVLPLVRFPLEVGSALAAVAEVVAGVAPERLVIAGLRFGPAGCAIDGRVGVGERELVAAVDQLRATHRGAIDVLGLDELHRLAGERCGRGVGEQLGLQPVPTVYGVAPGWSVVARRRRVRPGTLPAGVSALSAARALGGSVVLGDSGRLGVGRVVTRHADAVETLMGVEAGAPVDETTVDARVDRRRYSERGLVVLTIDDDGQASAECQTL